MVLSITPLPDKEEPIPQYVLVEEMVDEEQQNALLCWLCGPLARWEALIVLVAVLVVAVVF